MLFFLIIYIGEHDQRKGVNCVASAQTQSLKPSRSVHSCLQNFLII